MSTDKPEVDFPGGDPPADLQITDIWEGNGSVANQGDTVKVHYVGVAYSTGEEFDASWDRGEPLEFRLGAGRVIAGWDQGVQGMKVGGRRQLIIPPDLAYGDRGAGNVIAPGETLIFVCDLVASLDLDTPSRGDLGEWRTEPVTLRWILFHLTEETARHNGHIDILRELADGARGR